MGVGSEGAYVWVTTDSTVVMPVDWVALERDQSFDQHAEELFNLVMEAAKADPSIELAFTKPVDPEFDYYTVFDKVADAFYKQSKGVTIGSDSESVLAQANGAAIIMPLDWSAVVTDDDVNAVAKRLLFFVQNGIAVEPS